MGLEAIRVPTLASIRQFWDATMSGNTTMQQKEPEPPVKDPYQRRDAQGQVSTGNSEALTVMRNDPGYTQSQSRHGRGQHPPALQYEQGSIGPRNTGAYRPSSSSKDREWERCHEHIRCLQAMVDQYKGELARSELVLAQSEEKLSRLREAYDQLARTNAAAEQELAVLRHRQVCIEKKCGEKDALLEERQRQLVEAERFFGSADTISENDIATSVRALNAEIYQAVKQMADGCDMVDGDVDESAWRHSNKTLGHALTDHLCKLTPRADDRILLEIALQGTISTYLASLVSSWIHEPEGNRGIETIYKRMLRGEPQCIAGRWRSLTRKYATSRSEPMETQEARHVQILATHVAKVMKVARAELRGGKEMYSGLHVLVHSAMSLRQVVGEEVVGSDYQAFVVQAGEPFTPGTMIDEYAPAKRDDSRTGIQVVSSLSLGLRRCESGSREFGQRDGMKILVKPQVVLQTIAEDLGL